MKNSKSKKRLLYLNVLFLLTFLAGAAFALANGTLDIIGSVNIAAPIDYVRWVEVEVGEDLAAITGVSFNARQEAFIYEEGLAVIDSRTNQRIIWDIYFNTNYNWAPVFEAEILATARNESTLYYAIIDPSSLSLDASLINYGFHITINEDVFSTDIPDRNNPIAPLGIAEVIINVAWDGTQPEAGTFPIDSDGYMLIGSFVIEFDYELVP